MEDGFSNIIPMYAQIKTSEKIMSLLASVKDMAIKVDQIKTKIVMPISLINKKEVNPKLFKKRDIFTIVATLSQAVKSEKGTL